MDKYQDSLQSLLGTLTSRGRHYTGLTEVLATLLTDDLSVDQFNESERQKKIVGDARTILENATKHRELIETVLAEWQKLSIANVMELNASSSSDKVVESPEIPKTKNISKTDIQNIIKHIEYIKDSPRMFFNDDFSALSNFLRGFNYACFVLGIDAQYHEAYSKAQIERGWEVLPTHPIEQMTEAGLSKDEIFAMALDIELTAWKNVLKQLLQ